jgi:hypothetical protein
VDGDGGVELELAVREVHAWSGYSADERRLLIDMLLGNLQDLARRGRPLPGRGGRCFDAVTGITAQDFVEPFIEAHGAFGLPGRG